MNYSYFSDLIEDVTDNYLDKLDPNNLIPVKIAIGDLIKLSNEAIEKFNLGPLNEDSDESDPINVRYPYQKKGTQKFRYLTDPEVHQIAKLCILYFKVKKIYWEDLDDDKDNFSLAFYQNSGPNKGIYTTSENEIKKMIRSLAPLYLIREVKEVMDLLKMAAPEVLRNSNKDLICVNNGIFDYKNKKLLDFDPDYIFLSKSQIDFNPDAKLVNIEMPDGEMWNVEDWFKSLSDNEDVITSLWEITSAILRPYVRWNKAILLYSPFGNNGKGTLCQLWRNLLGNSAYTSISIKNFSREFMLTPLLKVNAVICDENDVGGYLDNGENFKLAITYDPILINIKNKDPKSTRFQGLIVQCINEVLKLKDKSESMYRRFLPILMDKRFEGKERKYIKDDYIYRKEVLEYVLYKALMSDFYEFSVPETSFELLDEMRDLNDPVRQFLNETLDECVWGLIPNDFLYELYKAWFSENMSNESKFLSKNRFLKRVKDLLDFYENYTIADNPVSFSKYCNKPEKLIYKYNLKSWMNTNYKGSDVDSICSPNLDGKKLRGFLRIKH